MGTHLQSLKSNLQIKKNLPCAILSFQNDQEATKYWPKQERPRTRQVCPCETSAARVPKDKAIRKYIIRNMVDGASMRDLSEASVYENYALPKIYHKQYYSVSAAIHLRIVHNRSTADKRIRTPPPRWGARPQNNNQQKK